MFSPTDTIVAIATPPGRGGIGVVRLSGPEAHAVARRLITHDGSLEPRRATLTLVRHMASEASGSSSRGRTSSDAIDQVVATFFPAPHSYTGDDVVELSAHGSPVILRAIVSAAIEHGARLAEPGEFTLRAFLNGRIDLMQAEAVADLINAVTPLQARAAFDQLQGTLTRTIAEIGAALFDLIARLEASVDFPEEGYHFVAASELAGAIDQLSARINALLGDARRGRLVREGLQIAIVGEPNVGKSSVFNALVGASRAIVADVPGTTRDLVTEVVDLEGLRVTLIDTAGLCETVDQVESEGVERARQAQLVSDLILVVVDRSQPIRPNFVSQETDARRLIVANKSDLPNGWGVLAQPEQVIEVSALTGEGMNRLRERIIEALGVGRDRKLWPAVASSWAQAPAVASSRAQAGTGGGGRAQAPAVASSWAQAATSEALTDRPEITNVRHIALVERTRDALMRARRAALAEDGSLSEEFVLADLQDARAALEEITGRRAPEDLLAHIFSRFCIGK
jgi:tRNA modification GTPase